VVQVIRGGESVKFTVSFTSHRSVPHLGYLLGEQKVFSPEMPISLKVGGWVGYGCTPIRGLTALYTHDLSCSGQQQHDSAAMSLIAADSCT
jgi:hypothetical protein